MPALTAQTRTCLCDAFRNHVSKVMQIAQSNPASPGELALALATKLPMSQSAGKLQAAWEAYSGGATQENLPAMISLNINGREHEVDVDPETPILWVLRDTLGMSGTKFGCGAALCGACTVHLDGEAIRSCSTPISAVESGRITTIEKTTDGTDRVGAAVHAAWVRHDVAQCGYCQSGQIMSATALLASLSPGAQPTAEEIDSAMAGNICRCGTYARIRAAIADAASTLV
jgi:isoquinoline 1-oxidoreductase alpha subunit